MGALKAISGLFERRRGLLLRQRAAQQFQQSRFEAAINDKQGLASALDNLSQTYVLLGEYRKALEYADASLEVMREIGYKLGEVRALSYQGAVQAVDAERCPNLIVGAGDACRRWS